MRPKFGRVTVQAMRDLNNGELGRRAAARLGERLAYLADDKRGQWPIDPHGVARVCGVKSVEDVVSLEESGRLETQKGGHRILVRASDSKTRKRFTVAHELGHTFFASSQDEERKYSQEEEARCNVFAAALLMPKAAFVRGFSESIKLGPTRCVLALAKRFVVGPDAVLRRLRELSLLSKTPYIVATLSRQGGVWAVDQAIYDRSLYQRLEGRAAKDLGIEPAQGIRPLAQAGSVKQTVATVNVTLHPRRGRVAGTMLLPSAIAYTNLPSIKVPRVLVGIEPLVDPASGASALATTRASKQKQFSLR